MLIWNFVLQYPNKMSTQKITQTKPNSILDHIHVCPNKNKLKNNGIMLEKLSEKRTNLECSASFEKTQPEKLK